MKGIIFTEFINLVEELYGYEMVDELISSSKLKSNGIYTSVGTYDHEEMKQLVGTLSKKTGKNVSSLLKLYGEHVFKIFVKGYPAFFEDVTDSFTFLNNVENHIHVEVLKLYPDAELPEIQTLHYDKNKLVLKYLSSRKLADFAEGLIIGCVNHFKENIELKRENITPDHSEVILTLTARQN